MTDVGHAGTRSEAGAGQDVWFSGVVIAVIFADVGPLDRGAVETARGPD